MTIHKDLASGKWFNLPLVEQLANVGSDVIRTISWRKKGNQLYSNQAFERALELLDLTIADTKNRGSALRELTRCREVLVDYFVYDNQYGSNDELWQNYFLAFNYATAVQRGR